VDGQGRPCGPGEPGRLVATALYAYHRPAIRLDLGLTARWDPAPAEAPGARPGFRIIR